ncbi:MAG: hypothetical protein H6905_06900 [Hyphomicrobiales bacterium]|nr:hypothetical protein [Hyphomicrobiales bacterium]
MTGQIEPFLSAESAWVWFSVMQKARHEGVRPQGHGGRRPCDIDDIAAAYLRLVRARRISKFQAHVLAKYGFEERMPDRRYEPREYQAWYQGLDALQTVLVDKGIVEPRHDDQAA